MSNSGTASSPADELDEAQLERVVGGVMSNAQATEPGGDGTPSAIDNVLRTRHDTAKNSISNVR